MTAALLALLCAPAPAAQLATLGGPAVPPAVYASPAPAWARGLEPAGLYLLPLGFAGASSLGPAVAALEARGVTPESFLEQTPERRLALLREAGEEAAPAVRAEARAAARLVRGSSPSRPEFPLLVARLRMLSGPLAPYLEAPELAEAVGAYRAAYERLSAAQRESVEASLKRHAEGLAGSPSPVEAVAASLPALPSRYLWPRVLELRREGAAAPPPPASPAFGARRAALRAGQGLRRLAARRVYRPLLSAFRLVMEKAGELWRKYVTGQEMGRHNFRWHVLETLFKKGDFRGAFGHPVHEGTAEVESPLIFPAAALESLRAQTLGLGEARWSPMVSISGMSFPQLSAPSVLSLLHNHLRLAKELGVRTTFNTGEGSPFLHLGLLEGDRGKVERFVVDWGIEHGRFRPGGWTHARISVFLDELFAARDRLFAGLSPEDISRAQIVAQFGSGLNGIRGPGSSVDLERLREIAASPAVVMTQFKLKQAAKRGAKVDASKLNEVVAAFRDIDPSRNDKGPEIIPDFASPESIAALVAAARSVTGKPVSLKFGIGRPKDILDFLAFLNEHDALPDHIQLDGRGDDFSPGSGNAPPGANTSLPANEAVIVLDAVLKKLGIRDRVVVEATGDILLPMDAVEKLALGADCVAAARGWMGMGLGCAMVRDCAGGKCPYGITAAPESFLELSLDPLAVAPKGYEAAANWFKAFTQTLAETGLGDWRDMRRLHGLSSKEGALRVQKGGRVWTLDAYYDPGYVSNLLRGALSPAEVRRLVFGGA